MNWKISNKTTLLVNTLKMILLSFCLLILVACKQTSQEASKETQVAQDQPTEKKEEKLEEVKEPTKVSIRSIGDILIHDALYWQAAQADGSYDFDSMFAPVKDYIANADITTANLEVIAAGHALGVSSYPLFNAPEEIIDSLQKCGVDIVNNATNHTLDFGEEGVHASINALKERELPYVGSYESWEDYNTHRILERNDLKVGFLSYAYGTNGIPIPEDKEYLISLIDPDLMALEVEYLKTKVDIGIIMVHNGEEYEVLPTPWQEELNHDLLKAGADFILGGHPHVVQPFEWLDNGKGILYSHGNFLSGQVETDTKLGGISEYIFARDDNGAIALESIRFMPTFCLGDMYTPYQVVPLADWETYGIYGGYELFEMIKDRMTTYSVQVEVVDYLD